MSLYTGTILTRVSDHFSPNNYKLYDNAFECNGGEDTLMNCPTSDSSCDPRLYARVNCSGRSDTCRAMQIASNSIIRL